MGRHVVGAVAEFPAGTVRILEIGRRSIGVLNVDGQIYAIRNRCPHHGAPLCRGKVGPVMRPGPPGQYELEPDLHMLRCPWHGYAFNLKTGLSYLDPQMRVRTYPTEIEAGNVVLYV